MRVGVWRRLARCLGERHHTLQYLSLSLSTRPSVHWACHGERTFIARKASTPRPLNRLFAAPLHVSRLAQDGEWRHCRQAPLSACSGCTRPCVRDYSSLHTNTPTCPCSHHTMFPVGIGFQSSSHSQSRFMRIDLRQRRRRNDGHQALPQLPGTQARQGWLCTPKAQSRPHTVARQLSVPERQGRITRVRVYSQQGERKLF